MAKVGLMKMKEITSLQNPLVKHLVKLRKEKKYREKHRSFLVEGKKLVNELCVDIEAKSILLIDTKLLSKNAKSKECFLVREEIIHKISGVRTPEGIIGEFPLPAECSFEGVKFLLALDGVSDPGNMGTLLRTALALGWEGAFILDNCCDPFNDKAVRSAKGATFRLPLKFGDWEALEKIAGKNHLYSIAADTEGKDVAELSKGKGTLLVLGSEAKGLSEESLKRCEKVTIPMTGKTESLNVSIAGGILMYLVKNLKP